MLYVRRKDMQSLPKMLKSGTFYTTLAAIATILGFVWSILVWEFSRISVSHIPEMYAIVRKSPTFESSLTTNSPNVSLDERTTSFGSCTFNQEGYDVTSYPKDTLKACL